MTSTATGGVSCGNAQACDCKGRRFSCIRCKRFVPYCFGGAGDAPAAEWPDTVCDDCWAQLSAAQGAEECLA